MKRFTRDECLQMIGTLDAVADRLSEAEIPDSREAGIRLAMDALIHRDRVTEAMEVIKFLLQQLDASALLKDRLSEWYDVATPHPLAGNEA
ncbi:MAG TPA: hypothetical protein PLR25_29855 [Planctomycetaceae bacterium]|nr:hypothetical protein [Planctomycetaceae bacterium]